MSGQKLFKCPICGCNEHYGIGVVGEKQTERIWVKEEKYGGGHYETNVNMPRTLLYHELTTRALEGSVSLEVGSNVNAYLCKECGYVSQIGRAHV